MTLKGYGQGHDHHQVAQGKILCYPYYSIYFFDLCGTFMPPFICTYKFIYLEHADFSTGMKQGTSSGANEPDATKDDKRSRDSRNNNASGVSKLQLTIFPRLLSFKNDCFNSNFLPSTL